MNIDIRSGKVEPDSLAALFTRHLGTIFKPVSFLETLTITKEHGKWPQGYHVVGRWFSHTPEPYFEHLHGEEEDTQLQLTTHTAPSILDTLGKFLEEKERDARGDISVLGTSLISTESDVLNPKYYFREMRLAEVEKRYYYLPLLWPKLYFHESSSVSITVIASGSVFTKKRFHDGSDNEQASIANLKRLAGAVYGFIEEFRDLIDNYYITVEHTEYSDEEDRIIAAVCPPFSKEKFTFL